MKSVDLSVRVPPELNLPISEALADAIDREEVISWDVDRTAQTLLFVSVIAGDRAVVEAEAPHVDVVTRLEATPIDKDTFYAYVEADLTRFDHSFGDLFELPDVVVVPPMIYMGGNRISMTVLGTEMALRELLTNMPSVFDVEIERVSEHRRQSESLAGRLTTRQFTALEVAAELGFFSVPREASLVEVATALDCSESTASTLLRTGVETLVHTAVTPDKDSSG